jgi:fumarate reductase subunit D
MAVSKKPIIWSLFAAGGTITAFLMPLLVLLIGLAVPLGWLEAETFSYTQIESLFGNPLIRLILFGLLFLSVWHAAHRMRITVHDFGLRADMLAAILFYSIALIATIILAIALL